MTDHDTHTAKERQAEIASWLRDTRTHTLEDTRKQAQIVHTLVLEEIASRLQDPLNAYVQDTLASSAHSDNAKSDLATWINTTLNELHLGALSPSAGLRSTVTYEPSGQRPVGRFRFRVTDPNGNRQYVDSAQTLPTLRIGPKPVPELSWQTRVRATPDAAHSI